MLRNLRHKPSPVTAYTTTIDEIALIYFEKVSEFLVANELGRQPYYENYSDKINFGEESK